MADGVLKQPVRGVFTFAGAPHTYEQDCAVALILGGPDAAIAGAAAARTPSGVRIGRVDFRRRPVIIECDGAEWHPDFEEDRKRWAALQSAGYLVLPATFQMVEFRTSEFIRTLRELTEQADRSALRRRGSG